jgi:hypothetical protein
VIEYITYTLLDEKAFDNWSKKAFFDPTRVRALDIREAQKSLIRFRVSKFLKHFITLFYFFLESARKYIFFRKITMKQQFELRVCHTKALAQLPPKSFFLASVLITHTTLWAPTHNFNLSVAHYFDCVVVGLTMENFIPL